VTHIDDTAIRLLREYYGAVLPREGRILDLCSSWISHFPPELEEIALASAKAKAKAKAPGDSDSRQNQDVKAEGQLQLQLQVIGMGMNTTELNHNPILSQRIIQDLNDDPTLPASVLSPLHALTCAVSIDYLTKPLQVLLSAHELLEPGSYVHLVISNRCFPTKVVKRWLEIGEEERLEMVGDYLHFAGFKDVEVVRLNEGRRSDPLWVVRGRKE
jgi:hypothetical protein